MSSPRILLYSVQVGLLRGRWGWHKRNCAATGDKDAIIRCSCADPDRRVIIYTALAILPLLGCLAPRGAVAEEAGTAPTCTGCSESSTERTKPIRKRSSSERQTSTAAAVRNDGPWQGVSVGPCIMTWTWTINVGNGTLTGDQTRGTVSSAGAVRGTMIVFSSSYVFVGHLNGSRGSGTWHTRECSGTWTAARP